MITSQAITVLVGSFSFKSHKTGLQYYQMQSFQAIISYQLKSPTSSCNSSSSKLPSVMCRSHVVRYVCGCEGQIIKYEKCDNRRGLDRRPLRPLRPGEADRQIPYFAALCVAASEKSFTQRNYKCAVCKRDDVLREKAEKEAEERRKGIANSTPKRKGKGKRKGKDIGMSVIEEEAVKK